MATVSTNILATLLRHQIRGPRVLGVSGTELDHHKRKLLRSEAGSEILTEVQIEALIMNANKPELANIGLLRLHWRDGDIGYTTDSLTWHAIEKWDRDLSKPTSHNPEKGLLFLYKLIEDKQNLSDGVLGRALLAHATALLADELIKNFVVCENDQQAWTIAYSATDKTLLERLEIVNDLKGDEYLAAKRSFEENANKILK